VTQFLGHAVVVKRDKRLRIEVQETGEVLYTVPDFLRHRTNRDDLKGLADHFTARQNRDIIAVIWFEAQRRP
jgi:3-hydroxy-3-methylglutaryl CoA synthase